MCKYFKVVCMASLLIFYCSRYVKVALLPANPSLQSVFTTKHIKELKRPTFGDTFNVPVPANKIFSKTLQVNVWQKLEDLEKCVVSQSNLFIFNIRLSIRNVVFFVLHFLSILK